MLPKATVLVRGYFRNKHGKTAHGLIRYGKRYLIASVIDETCAGSDAGELLGLDGLDVPIIENVPDDADVLIIGVAPSGGRLPPAWRSDIKSAIEKGMDIVSGLHQFIGDDPELSKLAEEKNVTIWDVRRPPPELHIAEGRRPNTPVVLTAGTDACVGKRTATMEFIKSAEDAGYKPGFIATGQTGVMIGSDSGLVVDSLPADFISGEIEKMIEEVEVKGKDIIFVEGQGSLSHHAYGSVAHGILYGSSPSGIIMAHAPYHGHKSSFPSIPMSKLDDELRLISAHTTSKLLGIALNCSSDLEISDCSGFINQYEKEFDVPADDVLKNGGKKIFKNIEKHLLKR